MNTQTAHASSRPRHPTVDRLASEQAARHLAISAPLFAPVGAAIHADSDLVEARSIAWALAHRLVAEDRGLPRLRASRIGRLVCRALHDADAALVQIASDWTLLFCLIDDWIERDSDALPMFEAALCGAPHPATDELMACADVRRRLASIASREWLARWDAGVRELLDVFRREAVARQHHAPLPLSLYAEMRRVSSGIPLLLLIHELSRPTSGGASAADEEIERSAARLIGYANDLHTFRREIADREVNNLVVVLADEEVLSLEDAVERASASHNQEAVRFFSLTTRALSRAGARSETERAIASAARAWVLAHNAWALETGRYDLSST